MFQFVYFAFVLPVALNYATILNRIYVTDVTFTQQNSPYWVTQDVRFNVNTTLTIEQGVEIIFNGTYELLHNGHINACPDSQYSSDGAMLSRVFTRGVFNGATAITFTSAPNITGAGSLSAYSGTFCNVYFRDMDQAISALDIFDKIYLYNAEFSEFYAKTILGVGSIYTYDSIFTNFSHGKVSDERNKRFYSCSFSDFKYGAILNPVNSHGYWSYIEDCDIIGSWNGEGTESCLASTYTVLNTRISNCYYGILQPQKYGKVENTTFSNCYIGMKIDQYPTNCGGPCITFNNNNFLNNHYALKLSIKEYQAKYNNFIGNKVIVTLDSDDDFDLSYNYFGTMDALNISQRMEDRCTDDWTTFGLVKFYPYFIEPLTYINIYNDYNATYGANKFETKTISSYWYEMYCTIADTPTVDPTMIPTSSPSIDPTTAIPTEMPITVSPTVDPSMNPTTADQLVSTTIEPIGISKSNHIKIAVLWICVMIAIAIAE